MKYFNGLIKLAAQSVCKSFPLFTHELKTFIEIGLND